VAVAVDEMSRGEEGLGGGRLTRCGYDGGSGRFIVRLRIVRLNREPPPSSTPLNSTRRLT